MVSDETYDICLPVLQDSALDDEEKTDKLEELLKEKTSLTGSALEHAILDALWRYREGGHSATSPPPIRQTILRRPSPASWRGSPTPASGSPRLGVSPLVPPGFVPSVLARNNRSSTASPFGSPRPSPRLAFAAPAVAAAAPPIAPIPHSPNLSAYQFAGGDETPSQEVFGDYQSDNVDWLVSDDAVSISSSVGGGGASLTSFSNNNNSSNNNTTTSTTTHGFNVAAPEFVSSQHQQQQQQADMTPYDMLRSILGPSRTDEEIDAALAMHGYDLGATVAAIMDTQVQDNLAAAAKVEETRTLLLGKALGPADRPVTPASAADQQPKSGVVCKFFLSTGQCLRADCRFSHDLSNHVCKYWVAGNCLAGSTCIFSHDPAHLVQGLQLDGSSTPPAGQKNSSNPPPTQDHHNFPALKPGTPDPWPTFTPSGTYSPATAGMLTPPPGLRPFASSGGGGGGIERPRSRPGSRHQQLMAQRDSPTAAPPLDDADAFPSLGSASAAGKQGKKHHGKRGGHGHGANKEAGIGGVSTSSSSSSSSTTTTTPAPTTPSTLADIVKMSPSPGPSSSSSSPLLRKAGRNGSAGGGSGTRNGENSAAAQAIPAPKHIPWLETGEKANKAYLKARQEAIKHGGLRNKFLQSAAQAWNRNDARAAKALSLRGQSENDLMRKAHREAARELYEERNRNSNNNSSEIYVDLHGLHPEEAVEYLERVLLENSEESRPVYAITGTGHHSKSGKDKVGRALRAFLNEWKYAFREFSVPGDRNNMGGILGIDARSWDRSLARERGSGDGTAGGKGKEGGGAAKGEVDILAQGVEIGEGKVKLLVRDPAMAKEPPKGPRGR